ncbi:hypothetical protein INT48_008295 [Thamnidium elegans]|uniref:JmjC domain-containing protein n=1 Tax=Thamnidium elegans TaxID=101142 RepID=A0A8H7VWP2_9FUNG|nr:hypothetical protein INT48_008295 [Thamnidium elegans]
MFNKAARLAKCLQSQTTEKVIVQDKPCNNPPFDKFNASCRGCEEEESCSFMGLRGFKVSKKTGKLLHGPYFPPTKKYNPLRRLKSLRFNTEPPSQKAPSYAMNKIKSAFHKILLRQKDALSKDFLNAPIRRENPEGYRHFCDSCYTSLFNYHFICSTCALEICPECFDKLSTTTSDDALLDCIKGDKHLKEEFVSVSKLPSDSMKQLIRTTTPEPIISDGEQYTNTHNETVDNNDCTNSKYNNQYSSNSDVKNTFSSADIQYHIQNNYINTPNYIQQFETLYYNSLTNSNTCSQQTQINSIQDDMNVDTLGFGTGNMFEPCYINNIKFIHTGDSGTYVLPSALCSTRDANCQVSSSNDGLMKLPPELFYERIFFNQVASGSKRPPQADFSSSNMIQKKRRGINNNYSYCHYSNISSGNLYTNRIHQDNHYNQVYQAPQPIHFTPPYHLLNNSEDCELYNGFSGYTGSKEGYAPRAIKTPKSRRPSAQQVPAHLSPTNALPQEPLLSPVPARHQASSSSTTPALSQPAARMLHISASALTPESFRAHWQTHQPAMISESTTGSIISWTPEVFETLCANETLEATDIDRRTFEVSGKDYFAAFSDRVKRKELCSALGSTEVLKIKDLPPNKSLKDKYPGLYQDFMKTLVTPEYCTADGYFNLANRLPEEYLPPDLGPKLFISYGSDEGGNTGRTNLHCDMTDAVNVMYYADNNTSKAVPVASALWHIFPYESFEKVGSYIAGHKEIGSLHPILDHAFYLGQDDLKALEQEYNVVPFTLYQNPGDTVYIPAGCAHQVTNYSNSIKCAYDFISPENVDRSVYISECFRSLKREDKLQLPTTLAFAWTSLKSDEI